MTMVNRINGAAIEVRSVEEPKTKEEWIDEQMFDRFIVSVILAGFAFVVSGVIAFSIGLLIATAAQAIGAGILSAFVGFLGVGSAYFFFGGIAVHRQANKMDFPS